ncbi:hypothetical protein GCM10023222_55600 [Saccharopolyspora cebuensis]
MRRRRLANTVLALLEHAGWMASADWIVRCRDERGRKAQLRVGVSTDGIMIDTSQSGRLTLTTTESGQLRAALRDALLTRAPLVPSEPPAPRRPGTPGAQALPAPDGVAHPRLARTSRRPSPPAPSEGSEDRHGKHNAPRWPDIDPDCRLRRAA